MRYINSLLYSWFYINENTFMGRKTYQWSNKMKDKNFDFLKSTIIPLSFFIFTFMSLFCFGETIRVPQDYSTI